DALIEQRAAAVERLRAAPVGAAIVLGRAIPRDAGAREDNRAERSAIDERLQLADARLQTILKDDAKRHARGVGCRDESVRSFGCDLERFFDQHVEAAARGGRAVLSVQA